MPLGKTGKAGRATIREPVDLPMAVVPQPGGVYRDAAQTLRKVQGFSPWTAVHEGELRVKYLFLLGTSLVVANPAMAQDSMAAADADLCCVNGTRVVSSDEITVTATGLWTRREDSGQSISVITAKDLETVQGPDPVRAIERLPGVSLARSGGLGSQTALFVRGADSQQLLVTIDGVRVEDTAAPSGGFDLGTLVTGGVGRIELLRGSNSLAWGSDAIGGVLAIDTDDRPGVRAGLEYGANNTVTADAGLGLQSSGHYALGLAAGYIHSDGISAFAGGTEPDPFRQWHLGGRGSLNLTDSLKLVAAGRYADSKVDFDGYPPPTYAFADTPEYQTTRQASGRVGLEYTGESVDLSGGVAMSDTRRAYYDPTYGTAPNFNTAGRSVHADLRGRARLNQAFTLDFGGDADWSRYSTTYDARQSARTVGGHVLLGYASDRLKLTVGGRVDDHDRFGSHWTMGANGSFKVGADWRLRASWGQGFKAPTLSQLYGYGGNTALKPETSEAFDFGLEYGDSKGGRFAITVFRRDSANLIDYVWPSGYFNIGRARAQGIELEGVAPVTDRFTLSAAYTYLDATNRVTGNQLARRPHQLLSASLDWRTPLAGLALGADLRMVGDSYDDPGNFTRLDGYGLVTLRASVPLGRNFELYGRVENVTDQKYQTAADYGTYGRSAYAGVRLKW